MLVPNLLRSAVLSLVLAASAQASASYSILVSEVGNLAEQMDTVAGLVHGNQAGYKAYWEKSWLTTEENRRQLGRWADIRRKYQVEYEPDKVEPLPLSRMGGPVEVAHKLRIAGYQAADLDDYSRRIDILLTPQDQLVLMEAIRHFAARFHEWWKTEALAPVSEFKAGLEQALADPRVGPKVESFRRFYRTPIDASYPVKFVLLMRPKGVAGPTHGEHLESYEAIEVQPGEKPMGRVPVMVHELCHFFSASRPADADRALQQRFATDPSGLGVPAYNMMEEAVATALGNGLMGKLLWDDAKYKRTFDRAGGFYNQEFIDAGAKAIFEFLDGWMSDGKSIDDPAFPAAYIARLKGALGDRLGCPSLTLFRYRAFFERPLAEVAHPAIAGLFCNIRFVSTDSMTGFDPDGFKALPLLPALLIVTPAGIGPLAKAGLLTDAQVSQIQATVRAEGKALFGGKRANGGSIYVVVSSKPEDVAPLVKVLTDLRTPLLGCAPSPTSNL